MYVRSIHAIAIHTLGACVYFMRAPEIYILTVNLGLPESLSPFVELITVDSNSNSPFTAEKSRKLIFQVNVVLRWQLIT